MHTQTYTHTNTCTHTNAYTQDLNIKPTCASSSQSSSGIGTCVAFLAWERPGGRSEDNCVQSWVRRIRVCFTSVTQFKNRPPWYRSFEGHRQLAWKSTQRPQTTSLNTGAYIDIFIGSGQNEEMGNCVFKITCCGRSANPPLSFSVASLSYAEKLVSSATCEWAQVRLRLWK
jgi:hypothetical protein